MALISSSSFSTTHVMELLGLLLDGSSAMVGIKDLEHRYIYANRDLETLFSVAPGSLIGKAIDEFTSSADANTIREKEISVLTSGIPERFSEHFAVGDNRINCSTIRFPLHDETGSISGIGLVAFDSNSRGMSFSETSSILDRAQKTIYSLQHKLEEMQKQARTDPLTGVWNRLHIEENMGLEISRRDRYGHPFSIVFIDLDHFKQVNDTWGHAAGDDVLKNLCAVVLASMRPTDMLGRWGGEEFIVVLPNTGNTSARLVAERIRAAVEAHTFPLPGRVTGSFGVATLRAGEAIGDLLERADAAMYRAKDRGRNRVETDSFDRDKAEAVEHVDAGFIRILWRPVYECGNPVVDEQHRILFEDVDHLMNAVLGGQAKVEICSMIDTLINDVIQHFHDEEVIFRAAGFPGADEHQQIHEELVRKAAELAGCYAEDRLSVGELFGFLAHEVVARHMLSDDRQFFPYINKTA